MIDGGCRCGACRYTLGEMPAVYCCHCTDCQTGSGSAFSEQAFMPASALRATGPTKAFPVANALKAAAKHIGCTDCGTRLWNERDTRPGFVVLRVGTLDDTSAVEPRAHIWVQSKQRWLELPAGVPQFAQMEPLADFLAVLGRAPG